MAERALGIRFESFPITNHPKVLAEHLVITSSNPNNLDQQRELLRIPVHDLLLVGKPEATRDRQGGSLLDLDLYNQNYTDAQQALALENWRDAGTLQSLVNSINFHIESHQELDDYQKSALEVVAGMAQQIQSGRRSAAEIKIAS